MNIFKKRNKEIMSSESLEMRNVASVEQTSYARYNSSDNFAIKSAKSLNNSNNNNSFSRRGTKSVNSMLSSANIHETLIRTFEQFYAKESENMIAAIEQSREEMRESIVEFFDEQSKYKEELEKASQGRYEFKRRKENSIPLAEYIRRKKEQIDPERCKSQGPEGQHPTDREAVERYLRRRERRKVAEKNQQNRNVGEEQIQNETKKILEKLQGMDITIEKERDRQAELLKQKLEEKKNRKDVTQIASDIIDNYQDSELAQERERLAQKEKIEARLSAVRSRRSAVSPNPIRELSSLSQQINSKPVADIDI